MMPDLESLGSIPLAAIGAALLVAAAWGLGGFFIGPLTGQAGRAIHSAWLQVAVGLNLVAWLGIVLGQCGVLTGSRPLWLLAVCAALGLPRVVRWWRERRGGGALSRVTLPWRRAPFPAAIAGVFAAITLGPALCPPTGWDELVYHHELPRRWLADGWPAFYPDLAYSGFPSLGETLFWLVAPLEGVIAPRLIVWVCWLVGLLLLFGLFRRRLVGGSALVLTLVFAGSSAVLMISANCYVESILLMNVAAMLLALEAPYRDAQASRQRAPAIVVGILAGGAAAVKLTGLALLVVPCLWYAFEAWQSRARLPAAARALATFLVVACCVALPFYVRAWLATGNPFYPYFAEWFTSDVARIETSQFHHALGDWAFGFRGVLGFCAAPLLLSFTNELYDGDFGGQLLVFILLAALALAGIARRRQRRIVLWPAAVSLVLYVFWFVTAQQARFAVPAALGLVLLAASGLQRLRGRTRQAALGLLIVAALVSAPWRTAGHYAGSWFTVLGLISPTAYVNEETDHVHLPLVHALLDHTPADARLMLLFDHRGFYLPRPFVIGTPVFQEAHFTPPEQFDRPERIMAVLQRERVTHVVMTRAHAGPDQAPGWLERLQPLLLALGQCMQEDRLRAVWQSERYVLLEVRQ
jgi:hypothetical protein